MAVVSVGGSILNDLWTQFGGGDMKRDGVRSTPGGGDMNRGGVLSFPGDVERVSGDIIAVEGATGDIVGTVDRAGDLLRVGSAIGGYPSDCLLVLRSGGSQLDGDEREKFGMTGGKA